MAGPYNKRGDDDTFALTVSDAYHWHRDCACHPLRTDHPGTYILIPGKGAIGRWASSWLQWLAKTHLEPRSITVLGQPSQRVLDIEMPRDQAEAVETIKAAIVAGPVSGEPMPLPPEDFERPRRALA